MQRDELIALLNKVPETGRLSLPEMATDADLQTVLGLAKSRSLTGLRSVELRGTQVGDRGVTALAQSKIGLQWLDLSSTQVGDEGIAALAQCTSMTDLLQLSLSGTHVGNEGVIALAQCRTLTSLQRLSLNRTQVGDEGVAALAESTCLTDLQSLELNGTKVGDKGLAAMAQSSFLRSLRVLSVVGTQLKLLPEQLRNSNDAQVILRFFREASAGSTLLEVKVPILGLGRSGKTLLGRRLAPRNDAEKKAPFISEHESTHAFEIKELDVEVLRDAVHYTCRVRIFDFGGQPEMHRGHRLFLADKRNVYLVLVSARKDRVANRLDYWLGMVRHCGAGAPVIVVVSHCDDHPAAGDHLQERSTRSHGRCLELLDPAGLSTKYGIPVEVVDDYSNHTGAGLQIVEKAIARAIAKLGAVFDVRFPTSFFKVKSWLEGRPPPELMGHAAFETYLTVQDFQMACRACGQMNAKQQDIWLSLLRDLGVVHWVGDRPEVKRNAQHALDSLVCCPEWVKNPVYSVVRGATTLGGIISQTRLDAILEQTSIKLAEDCRRIRALMLACELCFIVKGGDSDHPDYLVVDQIPEKPRGVALEWRPKNPPKKRVWLFDFLPDHLLTQLLGRWFPWRVAELPYYRNEIVLRSKEQSDCRLRIVAQPAGHQIELEYDARREIDWRLMHAKIESEIESILDPEGLTSRTGKRLWEEFDPEEDQRRTLINADVEAINDLIKCLLDEADLAHSVVAQEGLRDALHACFEASLRVKQASPRLAYRACFVANCAVNLKAGQEITHGFPFRAEKEHTKQVGEWLKKNAEAKQILLRVAGKKLLTLDEGKGEPFDSLRKGYAIAFSKTSTR